MYIQHGSSLTMKPLCGFMKRGCAAPRDISHRAHRGRRELKGQPSRAFPWLRQAHPPKPPQSSLRE